MIYQINNFILREKKQEYMVECNILINDLENVESRYLPTVFFSFSLSADLQLQNIFSALVEGQKEKTMSEKALKPAEPETHICTTREW